MRSADSEIHIVKSKRINVLFKDEIIVECKRVIRIEVGTAFGLIVYDTVRPTEYPIDISITHHIRAFGCAIYQDMLHILCLLALRVGDKWPDQYDEKKKYSHVVLSF